MNDIFIEDIYSYKDFDYLKEVLEKTLEVEKVENSSFSLLLVDEKTIQEINKKYRNIDKITDVLSFAFEDNVNVVYNNFRLLGEIYICIPKMIQQAREYGHSEKRELSFLAVHGLLHLLGYDHNEEKDELEMLKKQEEILNGCKIKR